MIDKLYEIKELLISKKYLIILIIVILVILLLFFNRNNSTDMEPNIEKDELKKEIVMSGKCSVDIKGYIINPGLYEIECDKRINDVIKLAGGLKENSDTSVINLSKKIKDGMTIVVYSNEEVVKFTEVKQAEIIREEKCKTNSVVLNDACITKNERADNDNNINVENETNNSKKEEEIPKIISINNATKEELMTLKGIGEAKALDIIKYREENGPFNSIEELKNIKGIGEKMFEKIKDFIIL